MNEDKIKSHIKKLQEKHDYIEEVLRESYMEHATDEEIHDLKKRKLEIRDEIEQCKRNIP